jgi:glucose/arabinose dehydrogenase
MRLNRSLLLIASLPFSIACAQGPGTSGDAPKSPTPRSREDVVKAETVARGLEHPWGMAFLPDGRLIVTEKPGRVRIVSMDGKVSAPLTGVPAVEYASQGGMLDVVLDPNFARNKRIYLSYAEPGANNTSGTAVSRAVLGETGLDSVTIIYQQQPKVRGGGHFGSRLVFGRDGTLFITQGDRFSYRERAQDLDAGMGKVMRINTDGTIPKDNPFVGRQGAQPGIWSLGHRNMQGAFLHPETGQLWTVEHGAAGGDELNHPEAGKNYGWPIITYGRDYNGSRIGVGQAREGLEQPVYYWDPVIAASGLLVYTGSKWPQWKNNFFVGGLSGPLVRLEMTNGRVTNEERYLGELRERIRDVEQGPDGYIYLITDSGMGRVLRVVPVKP